MRGMALLLGFACVALCPSISLAQAVDGFSGVGGVKLSPAYTGPGDFISFTNFYGLRAYSNATRGNALVNACNSTGGVDVGCGDLLSDATTGALVPATISGITCPGANCTVKTAYDLTGNGVTITQATVASRPTLPATGSPGGGPTITCNGSQLLGNGGTGAVLNQPFSITAVTKRTGGTTDFSAVFGLNAGGDPLLLFYATNKIGLDAGATAFSVTAADNAWHYVEALFNTTTSSIMVDGSLTTGGSAGTDNGTAGRGFCSGAGPNLIGNIQETGVASGDQSALFSLVNSNQNAYWAAH